MRVRCVSLKPPPDEIDTFWFPGVVRRYGHPGTYLDMPRTEVDVEVQFDTSRWVVVHGCWTLCYRFVNPNPAF